MAVRRLSEIASASPAPTDQIVGVKGGATDALFLVSSISGTGIPGGSPTDIQFNNSGSFGGDSGFTYAGSGGPITITPAFNNNPFNISNSSTTGTSTDVLGLKVAGTLNTSGVVDGAVLFANITNTSSGAGSTLLDLQVASSSVFNIDMAGNIFIAGSGEVSSSSSLELKQTGDTFGPTGFLLQNRSGVNGAVFEQLGTVSVVDFVFKINGSGGFNGQSNIRYERRTAFFGLAGGAYATAPNTAFELQFGVGVSTIATFYVGDTVCGYVTPSAANASFYISGAANVVTDMVWVVNTNGPFLKKSMRLESRSADFLTAANTVWEFQIGDAGNAIYSFGDTAMWFGKKPQFSINTTGGGSALLGGNCPASTVTAPYTWIEALSSDGSLVYIPAWK